MSSIPVCERLVCRKKKSMSALLLLTVIHPTPSLRKAETFNFLNHSLLWCRTLNADYINYYINKENNDKKDKMINALNVIICFINRTESQIQSSSMVSYFNKNIK